MSTPANETVLKVVDVVSCRHVYTGNNDKGEFKIYEITAKSEQGAPIEVKLTSFADLPLGPSQYEVSPYRKNGRIESYTLKLPKGAAMKILQDRVSKLEEQVRELQYQLARQGSAVTPSAVPESPAPASPEAPGARFGDDPPW